MGHKINTGICEYDVNRRENLEYGSFHRIKFVFANIDVTKFIYFNYHGVNDEWEQQQQL